MTHEADHNGGHSPEHTKESDTMTMQRTMYGTDVITRFADILNIEECA